MKGKQAARAANRRAETAEAQVDDLKQRLKAERTERATEVQSLKDEIGHLKNSLIEQAGKMAAEEIMRLGEEAMQLRWQLSEAAELQAESARSRDYLIRSMCQYLSLTEGVVPAAAVCQVIPWLTGERFVASAYRAEDVAERLALPLQGWVITELNKAATVMTCTDDVITRPLSAADEYPDEFKVHPQYRAVWYEKVKPPRLMGRSGNPVNQPLTYKRKPKPRRIVEES